jgi:sulfide:quinone oxidoreductase
MPPGEVSESSVSERVVIVGGGVAGLEALLALCALLGDRVALTLVSRDDWFVDRPVTVAEPFGKGLAARHRLAEIAEESGVEFVHAAVASVDGAEHRLSLANGETVGYDTLILAPGARPTAPFADAITFGLEGSGPAVKEMLGKLRDGEARSVAFVVPGTTSWVLPLYELALMTAGELARSDAQGVEIRLVTPEQRPIALFGEHGSESIARLLAAAGIEFIGETDAKLQDGQLMLGASRDPVAVDYVVTLPLLSGPGLPGVPSKPPHEFIPTDEYGRVQGLGDVYAVGDAVDFPVKQGGLAAQQADTVAEHVAARHGASADPAPFAPALRGLLFTGREPRFMRSGVPGADADIAGAWYALWWPPTKVAGRYLAPYLFARSDVEGLPANPKGFTDIEIPLTAATLPG